MSHNEWKTVGLFLLTHFTNLVNREGAPADTDLENMLAILREKGSVDFENRDRLCSLGDAMIAEGDLFFFFFFF